MPLTLLASGLQSKWGFQDGEALLYYCDEHDIDRRGVSHKALLVHLVKKHLLPAVPRKIVLPNWETIHNPARIDPDDDSLSDYLLSCNVAVQLADFEIESAIEELRSKT